MFNEQESATVDACRFCFMCRHVCTLGSVSGWESDTPRGKGLILSQIFKGYANYGNGLAEAIYRCCLCGVCRQWCRGGYDMPAAILAARRNIVALGAEPDTARRIRTNILSADNPFGLPPAERFKAIARPAPKMAEVLYYVGCDTAYYQPEIANAFIRILTAGGVDFTLLEAEASSGKPLTVLGYREEAENAARELAVRIRSTGCRILVTACPSSYDAFKRDYGALLEGIEILHATEYVNRLLDEGRFVPRRALAQSVTPQDSDYLCRYNQLDDAPRRMLAAIPDLELKEMEWTRGLALSCGEAGGVFRLLYSELSRQLAARVLAEANRTGARRLATVCPITKQVLTEANHSPLEIRDVVELFAESLA